MPAACTTKALALDGGSPGAATAALNLFGCYAKGNSVMIPPALGQVGNMGRNTFPDSGFRNVDFSLAKNWHLGERVRAQFRAEFFNLFNHPNFANPELPNFIADPAVNGLDSAGRSIGSYALTATGDVGIGNPFLGGGGPRGLQLAAKISF